jgi:hypothetical protein
VANVVGRSGRKRHRHSTCNRETKTANRSTQ